MQKLLQTTIIILIVLSNLLKADQFISLNDLETYDYLEYLSARGEIDLPFSGSKPYSSEKILVLLKKIEHPSTNTAKFIEKFKDTYFEKDNRFLKFTDGNSRLSADPVFDLQAIHQSGKNFSDHSISEMVSNTAFKAQVDYEDWLTLYSHTGVKINHLKHQLRDDFANQLAFKFNADNEVLSEDYTETYLKISSNNLELALGKFPIGIGSGYLHSLTLSPQKYYYENLLASWQFSYFKFTTVAGFLIPDQQTYNEIIDSTITNGEITLRDYSKKRPKYLAAHRLEWQPTPIFSMGINEAVIYGDRPVEPGYLLPFLPLRWTEHYYGDQDNATMSFDFKYRPVQKVVCYGELFVDDETFTKSFTEYYGNKWAVLGGFYLADILTVDNLNFRFEASRTEPYVYTHKFHINRYMNLDNFLGGKYGTDSESLEFQLDYRPIQDLYFKANYEHASVGEPIVGKEDQPLYLTDVKSFLRGTVEKHRVLTFSGKYYLNRNIQLNSYYSHQEILNHNHQNNRIYINNSFSLGFSWTLENYYKKYWNKN